MLLGALFLGFSEGETFNAAYLINHQALKIATIVRY
jgi:hypothetical protein